MLELRGELIVFLVAVLTGGAVRLAYRCITCFRQLIKHSLIVIGIEDTIFWIASALYVFVQIYYTSSGSIRWYFILGIVLGALICSFILRKLKKSDKKDL